MKFRFLSCIFFFLPLLAVFASGNSEKMGADPNDAQDMGLEYSVGSNSAAGFSPGGGWGEAGINGRDSSSASSLAATHVSFLPLTEQQIQAERILRAVAEAYPDRIGGVEFREGESGPEGDWAIQVYGEWFYYADGRFLPESLRDKADEYDPLPFYRYTEELPPWRAATPEESQRMREQVALLNANPAKRSPHFFDALWRSHNRDEAWEHVKQIRFLGTPVLVHYSILTNLSLVEEQIMRVSKTNRAVKQWIDNLGTVGGWSWRDIALTESRSFHSYGAAIDLLPDSYGGLETYWVWAARTNSEWWNIPYTKRIHPPNEVIKVFESFGFVWGGKWRYFDTMHFEYRPEILILNNMRPMDLRDLR